MRSSELWGTTIYNSNSVFYANSGLGLCGPADDESVELYQDTAQGCIDGSGALYTRTAGILDAYGEWEIIISTQTIGALSLATDVIIRFIYDGAHSYSIVVSGDNYYLKKDAATLISFTRSQATEDVTLKVTRTAAGLFELFSNTVSKGTATDNTYTTCQSISLGIGYWNNHYQYSPSLSTVKYCGGISSIRIPSNISHNMGATGKSLLYDNKLYTCYESTNTAFTFTNLVAQNTDQNIPVIQHINARDICVWSRDGSPTAGKNQYLVAAAGNSVKCYNGETLVATLTVTPYATCVVPIDGTRLAVFGTTAEQSGVPCMSLITMTAAAWTVVSTKELVFDGGIEGSIPGSYAFDSSGLLYVVTNNMGANPLSVPSRMLCFTSTDLLATNPRMSAQYTMTGFMARGVFSMSGAVYLYGAFIEGTKSYAGIIKFPGTTVWRSEQAESLSDDIGIRYNHGIPSIWQNANGVVFIGTNPDQSWDPIMELMSDGLVRDVAAFESEKNYYPVPNNISIGEYSGRFYVCCRASNVISRTAVTRGGFPSTHNELVMTHSKMGGNTQRINKSLYSVLIGLTSAYPVGETLTVKANGTTIGTITSASGVDVELVLASALTAPDFTITLHADHAATWQGSVKEVCAKYVPTQFKKKAWGFGIRATKRLKFGDGSRESRTPATMFADIEAAWASNTPVTFIDVDGTSYTVLVTDFKQKRPLLSIDRQSGNEAFYFLELLQI